jgi:hypothetical protein
VDCGGTSEVWGRSRIVGRGQAGHPWTARQSPPRRLTEARRGSVGIGTLVKGTDAIVITWS